MALTLVSRIRPPNRSRSWVSQRVHLLEPARLYPSVCLGRADCCVSKQLLNCPQIGTSLEQVRRERVPQGMRRDAACDGCAPHPAGQAAAHVRGGKALARLRDEERGLLVVQQRWPATLEIAGDRAPRGLARGHYARLRALAE